jgi:riboflavin biosynthesis pyrimidine reductase
MSHLIRLRSDAILIGAQTAVTDDPSLTGEMDVR